MQSISLCNPCALDEITNHAFLDSTHILPCSQFLGIILRGFCHSLRLAIVNIIYIVCHMFQFHYGLRKSFTTGLIHYNVVVLSFCHSKYKCHINSESNFIGVLLWSHGSIEMNKISVTPYWHDLCGCWTRLLCYKHENNEKSFDVYRFSHWS